MEEAGKKPVEILIAQYAESHRNPINEVIHFICVPVIMWTFLGLFWTVHPLLAVLVCVAALVYYFSLSISLGLGMLLLSGAMLLVVTFFSNMAAVVVLERLKKRLECKA